MLYRLVWIVAYIPARLLFRIRFLGRENLPRGPVILSGNHVSYLDPLLLALVTYRPVHYMAKTELFEGAAWFAWLIRSLHAFPVKRGTPDREALGTASRLLRKGGAVGIFPEGTRAGAVEEVGTLGEAFGGAAFVSMRTGAPIVPVGFAGTDRALPRGARAIRLARVTIVLGEPLSAEDAGEGSRRERMDALTAMLMERIALAVRRAGGEES